MKQAATIPGMNRAYAADVRTRTLAVLVTISLLLPAGDHLRAAEPEADAVELPLQIEPGQQLSRQFTSKAGRRYVVHLPPAAAAELLLQQVEGAVDVELTDGEHEPISIRTEAGRAGRVQTLLVSGDWQLKVTPRRDQAVYDLGLAAAHVATAIEKQAAEGFRRFASAEMLRRLNYRETAVTQRPDDIDARTRGEYAAAISAFAGSADGCSLRRGYIGLARMQVAIGDFTTARANIDLALAAQCMGDLAEQAQALKTRGMAMAYQGDLQESAAAAEQALALYRRTGDVLYQGVVLGNLSSVYTQLGATDRALQAAQGSLDAARATADMQGVVYALKSIAAIQLARGELGPALAAYRATLAELARTAYPMIEGETWNDLGILYHRMADYDAASRAYSKAQDVWARMQNRSGAVDTQLNQGELQLDSGARAPARETFAKALSLARQDGLKGAEVRALRGLGAALSAARDSAAARVQFEASLDLARSMGDPAAQSYAVRALGELAEGDGKLRAAAAGYREALALARVAGDRDGEAATLAALARASAAGGDVREALPFIQQALGIVEIQRGQIADPSLRTNYYASFRAFHDLHVDILMRLDAIEPGHGYAAAALAAAERARARALQDALVERQIRVERAVDPALAAAETAAAENLRTAAFQLARLPPGAAPARRGAVQRTVDDARQELDMARGRIRAASPRYAELIEPAPLTLAELQQQMLDPDTAVLEFWLGERESYLWVVTRTQFRTLRLPARSQIERRATALLALLQQHAAVAGGADIRALAQQATRNEQALGSASAALGRMVLRDGLRAVAPRRIVVVGDGALLRVPFGILHDSVSTTPLRTRADIAYLPSLTTLRWLRSATAPDRPPVRLAVLADPVFRPQPGRAPHAELSRGNDTAAAQPFDLSTLAQLPNSRREAQAIAALLPAGQSWLAMDYAATRDAVLHTDWKAYSHVHFAAHSLLDLRRPELSGIVLSLYDRDGEPVDGILRVNDIYNLDMPAELVVLSACETGAGPALNTEGVFSLARAFFFAGTPRVVASLWQVDDRATARFMEHFYRALLLQRRPAAAALRVAQQAMARDPRWSATWYWAGFVLQGDWR